MTAFTNLPIPDRLINSFKAEGVVAFVGAGLSMNEGLPSWQELMELLLGEIAPELNDEEIHSVEKHLGEYNYLLVADYLKDKLGRLRYNDFIERHFIVKKSGKAHQLLTSLPLSGIITTNYDEILSQSDKQRKFDYPFTWDDAEVFRKTKRPFILHAHGIATNPGSTILSSSDYANLSHNNANIKFWEAMQNIFQNRRVLFLGYSLNDPDLNLFLSKLSVILPGNTNEHFALIISSKKDPLNIHRIKQLGVTPIFLNSDKHGEMLCNWLREVKLKSTVIDLKAGTPIPSKGRKTGSSLPTTNNLKERFIEFLNNSYPNKAHIINILKNFDPTFALPPTKDHKLLWKKIILKLDEKQIKRFIIYMFSIGATNSDMRRLVTLLP